MTCNQCQMLSINGVPCHETGCPNARKQWIESRGEWVRFVACRECGCDVEIGESCDCQETQPSAIEEIAARVNADPTDSDFLFGMTVFCMDYHGGQSSTEYAAMCEANAHLRDNHIDAIRRGKHDPANDWEDARRWYRELKRNAREVAACC